MQVEVNMLKERVNHYLNFIKSKKVVFLVLIGVSMLVGLLYASFKKPKYESNLSFIINENDKGIGGSLLSLAGQSGLLMGSGGMTPNEDKIMFLFSSRKILGEAMMQKSIAYNGEDLIANQLIEELKIKSYIGGDTLMDGFEKIKSSRYEDLTKQENKAIDIIIDVLLKGNFIRFEALKKKSLVGQGTGVILLQAELKDELLSKALVEQVYVALSDFYINNAIQKQQSNVDLLQHKVDSISSLLRENENALGAESDYNFSTFKASGRIKEYRLKRDIEMLSAIYGEVMKNYELAKLTLEQQKPFFKVIDSPSLPLKAIYKSKIKYTLLAGFAAALGLLGYFSFIYFRRLNAQKLPN